MTLSGIYTYILKSCKATSLEKADIEPTGIRNDRTVVAVNDKNIAITGREFPRLTAISASIHGDMLQLSDNGKNTIEVALPTMESGKTTFRLFRNDAVGLDMGTIASDWLSNLLQTSCRLISIKDNFRPIEPKHGGRKGDRFGYADASPIHLVSEESLHILNSRLDKKVTPLHFRPNLVVKGLEAFEEDNWNTVTINDCEFEVHHKCKRCIFTTIDPITSSKNENIEPLSTLAKFRKERNESLTFGIYLVPRKTGNIQLGNTVRIKK